MVPQASRKRLDDGWVEDGRRTFWRCWELYSNFWYLHEYSPWNFNQSYFTYISITIAGFDWKHVIFCPNFDANLCFSLMSGIRGIPHALVSTNWPWVENPNATFLWEVQSRILGKIFSEAHVFFQQRFDSALKVFLFQLGVPWIWPTSRDQPAKKKQNKQVNHQTKWPYQHTNLTEKHR